MKLNQILNKKFKAYTLEQQKNYKNYKNYNINNNLIFSIYMSLENLAQKLPKFIELWEI